MNQSLARKTVYVLVAILLIFGSLINPEAMVQAQTGSVVATVTPSDSAPDIGEQFTATISINMSGVNSPNNLLGSYSASLTWNPAIVSYASNSGAPPVGFTGSTNTANTATGSITFNGANSSGAAGTTIVIIVTFNVIGSGAASLDLNITAMAAATTFNSLLGILTVNEASVTVPGGSTHTITFNANGGTGTMTPQTSSIPAAIKTNTFTRSGYNFTGWNTAANGTGTAYANAATYSFAADITLYAQWTLIPVTVTFTGTELLGRPTDTSISVKIVPDVNIDLYYEYGTSSGVYTTQTAQTTATAGVPKTVEISDLNPNTQYFYRMQYRPTGGSTWVQRAAGSFWTQRALGSTFTFDITSDSHVDIMLGNATTWTNTLNRIATDDPDFLFDLGDTVAMYDNVGIGDVSGAETVYKDQLDYFNIVSDSSAIFLAPGNHENQEGWHYYNGANSRNIIGVNAQKKFFMNPVPDDFYTGDMLTDANIVPDGFTEAYYSFVWGDALFVVINPYWYTTIRPYQTGVGGGGDDDTANVIKSGETWDWTLGKAQFDWLKATLEGSNAKYKFILTHQLVSDGSWTSQEDYGHGGAKTNHIGEWGGYDENGTTYAWAAERPGWGADPVHDILADNCVSTVFHGHDHQYAYESRDGVIYTAAPSSSFTGNFNGYTQGGYTLYANSNSQQPGYIKVSVGPSQATVSYIKTSGGTVDHTYTVNACTPTTHTITFNANGGSGTMTPQTASVPTAIKANTFTRSGYNFTGWNTAANGSGTAYADGATYSFAADVTLYAQWTALPNHTVTFDANGGTGSMSPQIANVPTALTLNVFARLGFTFTGWNTVANGSGAAYADGATYNFVADVTLYAQWTALPNHTVTFNVNGGAGTIPNQVSNVPTALTLNVFTRLGFTFAGWNTVADGSGTAYADGATYSFAADVTLYAQWTALPNHTVTFDANGGTGTMAPQVANVPTALTLNVFTRLGFTFTGWNTATDGSGAAYADGASYDFSADITLYAQWTIQQFYYYLPFIMK